MRKVTFHWFNSLKKKIFKSAKEWPGNIFLFNPEIEYKSIIETNKFIGTTAFSDL